MKRNFTLLISILLISSTAWARTMQDAAEIANTFMSHRGSRANIVHRLQAASRVHSTQTDIELAFTQDTKGDDPAVYVFNNLSGGFVLISANDDTRTILGYADEGKFDPNNIPANMQFWLQMYADEVSKIGNNPVAYSKQNQAPKANVYSDIEPLLGDMEWGQNEPFNNMCPTMPRQEYRSVTGCVATALSQIMAYHKYPQKGVGSHSYSYGGTTISADFNIAYDWDNMLPRYGYYDNYTAEQANAVATLMYHVGVAAEMQYSQNGSGTSSSIALAALNTYFGYDADIKILPKDYVKNEEILAAISNDLLAGYPVYMDGSTKNNEGHAFVCDGMNVDGYLHINWGWDGWSNGYFSLSALDPELQGTGGSSGDEAFTEYVCAFTGIRPDEGGKATPTATVNKITRTSYDNIRRNQSVSFSMQRLANVGTTRLDGKIGYNIYNSDGAFVSKVVTSATVNLAPGYYYTSSTRASVKLPSTLSDGEYELEVGFADADSIYAFYVKNIGLVRYGFEIRGDSIFFQPKAAPSLTINVDCNSVAASWSSDASAYKVEITDIYGKSVLSRQTTQTSLQQYMSDGVYTLRVTPMDETFSTEVGYTVFDDFVVAATADCPYAITNLVVSPHVSSMEARWTCGDANEFDVSLYKKNTELDEWELYYSENVYAPSYSAQDLMAGEYRIEVHALKEGVKVGLAAQSVFTVGNEEYTYTIRIQKDEVCDMDLYYGLWLWWWVEGMDGQAVEMTLDEEGWYSTTIISQNSTINCLAVNRDVSYSWGNSQQTVDYLGINGDVCLLIGSFKNGKYDLFETLCDGEDENCYRLTVVATDGGKVEVDPSMQDCYAAGTRVSLTAIAEEGYYFTQWSDGITYAKRNITMTKDYDLQAYFKPEVCYALRINQTEGGVVIADPKKECYVAGKEVTLTAIAHDGYAFSQWSDGELSAQRTIVMNDTITLSAVFIANLYTLTLEAGVGGTVQKSSSATQYVAGAEVVITATPNVGYEFVCWSDGNTNMERTLLMNDNYTIKAIFRSTHIPEGNYTLTLTHGVGGTASTYGSPADYYASGDKIIITANADAGYVFEGWSDGLSAEVRRIIITQDTIIHASFKQEVQGKQYKLVLTADEGGIVTQTPNRALYDEGAYVAIAAEAKEGFEFVEWDDHHTSPERVLAMTQDYTLHASFYRLPSVNDVTDLTLSNSNLRITAKWKSEAPRFDVTITNSNEEIVKNEIIDNTDDLKTYRSNMSKEGVYIVRITPLDYSDVQIGYAACDTILLVKKYSLNIYADYGGIVNDSVNGEYEKGQSVEIVATPNNGYRFLTWDDGDNNAKRTLIMDQDYSLMATFKRIPTYTLTIFQGEHGVASMEAGTYTYQEKEQVTLTAIPDEGYIFAHWMVNGVEDTNAELTLTMTQDYTVYPVCVSKPVPTYTLTILPTEFGKANIEIGKYTYNEGEEVTLLPLADENYLFDLWMVNGEAKSDSVLVLVMDKDYEVMPTFKPNTVGVENLYDGVQVRVQENMIIVEASHEQDIVLYDLVGHLVGSVQNSREAYFTVRSAGLYLLRTHSGVQTIRIE